MARCFRNFLCAMHDGLDAFVRSICLEPSKPLMYPHASLLWGIRMSILLPEPLAQAPRSPRSLKRPEDGTFNTRDIKHEVDSKQPAISHQKTPTGDPNPNSHFRASTPIPRLPRKMGDPLQKAL